MAMLFLFRSKRNGYKKRITDVAEKLHRYAEKLRKEGVGGDEGDVIQHEVFRDDYMRAGVPESDLERKVWVEKRSNVWKDDVNEKLCELKYTERLFSEHNIGYKLLWGRYAMFRIAMDAMKQSISISLNKSIKLGLFSENLNGVWIGKGKSLAKMLSGEAVAQYLYGKIGRDKSLTSKEKTKLFDYIEEVFPTDKEEVEE